MKNLKGIILVTLLVAGIGGMALYYVSDRSADGLRKQIIAMDGMHMDLSLEKARAIYGGVDSAYESTPARKLVLFVDSTSCSGCFLSHLLSYYEINDSLVAHGGEMVVLLHPKKSVQQEIESKAVQERYPFWCIVDRAGEFIRKNPDIPDNQLLHTFLLDENDNLVLVGDPARNSRIKELFCREINNEDVSK